MHLFDPLEGHDGAREVELRPMLDQAQVVVSLDDDLLGPGPRQAIHARAWGDRHGDARTRSPHEAVHGGDHSDPDRRQGRPAHRRAALPATVDRAGAGATWSRRCFGPADCRRGRLDAGSGAGAHAARERSLLTAGRFAPPQLRSLAAAINQALGNIGRTCDIAPPLTFVPQAEPSSISFATSRPARGGTVRAGREPGLSIARRGRFRRAYAKVPLRVHAGLHVDETARAATGTCRCPIRSRTGATPDPRTGGRRSFSRSCGRCTTAGRRTNSSPPSPPIEPEAAKDIVRQTWARNLPAIRLGRGAQDRLRRASRRQCTAAPRQPRLSIRRSARQGEVEIVFRPDPTIHDGSFANNGWLQELPKPLFKTTWDNVVAISPELARSSRSTAAAAFASKRWPAIEGPAWVLPGQPERVVTLFLGYGRTRAGRIGTGIGYDAYRLRGAGDPWIATARAPTGGAPLATTQEHHMLDAEGEDLVRTVTPDHPSALRESDRDQASFYPPWPGDKPAWGMVIDLDRCIGCNACVVACQAENNIPVVGKDQVAKGREMALAAGRPLLCWRSRRAGDLFPAGALHALRAGAVRNGMPGPRNGAQPRRAEPDGLQPLHRDADLLELLSVQGAALQLVRLYDRRAEPDRGAAQPRCYRARSRRHGEMHLLHPADRGGDGPGRHREPAGPRRRSR